MYQSLDWNRSANADDEIETLESTNVSIHPYGPSNMRKGIGINA